MNPHPNVFSYSDPREFMAAVLHQSRQRNPRYSLRAFARQLGYRTPSYISQVLRGERRPSTELVGRLGRVASLGANEEKYLQLLVLYTNSDSSKERHLYRNLLATMVPSKAFEQVEKDKFRLISDWYHLVIRELIELRGFREDYEDIAKKLGHGLSPHLVKGAVKRLLRLGLIARNDKGKLTKTSANVAFGDGNYSEAIRTHHRQMLGLAITAIEGQEVNERHLTSHTFAIKKADLAKAAKLIERFHQEMAETVQSGDGDAVYHINVQLFKSVDLTNSQGESHGSSRH